MLDERGENKGAGSTGGCTPEDHNHGIADGACDTMATPRKSTVSPAFQVYPNEFLGDPRVQVMSATEVGVYWLLIMACWNAPDGLPLDMKRLSAIGRMKASQFERIWRGIMHECFDVRGDRVFHRRVEKERKKQAEFRKQQKEKAEKGWQSRKNATALPESEHRHMPSNALQSSSSSSSSTSEKRESPRAPIHDNSHRKHAHCGRVCLPASLFSEFVRRRNHDGADREIRDWALAVEHEWAEKSDEPGDAFDFWKARYSEKWPTARAAAIDKWEAGLPEWARKVRAQKSAVNQ